MTQKITISVPDDLHEKMMQWKDSFNFSKVFQNAISDLIQKKEEFQKRLKGEENMTAIIERLKREKEKSEKEWFEQGKIDGLDFAKSAGYEELRYALKWETMKESKDGFYTYDLTKDEILGEYFEYIMENNDSLDFDGDKPNELFEEWEAGWKEGIEEFWNEVKDKI